MMGRRKHIGLAILILLFFIIQIIPINVDAVGSPTVRIQFDEPAPVIWTEVGPNSNSVVTIPGSVQADNFPGETVQEITVKLYVTSEAGWDSSVSPALIVLTSEGAVGFTVQVVVPPGTSCEIVGKVTLTGTAETNPGAAQSELQPITATIRVEQYCFFLVDSSKPTISTSPGSQVKFDLVIQNQGNGRDEFLIEIYNKETLERNGFKITQSDLRIEIDEGGQKEVQIIVDTPSGTNSIGQHSIMVKIESVNIHSKPPRYSYFEFLVEVDNQYILLTTEFFFLIGAIIIIIVLVILIRFRRNKQKRSKGNKKRKNKKS